MARKRRRSSFDRDSLISSPLLASGDPFTRLSDELILRILHQVPISTLLQCQQVSHRFYDLAGDSQIWKDLYYSRFVRPRTLRNPGARAAQADGAHRAKRRKWQHETPQADLATGKSTNWKSRYKLRHNWSIGTCEVQEIRVSDGRTAPSMLVSLAEGMVLTVDIKEGLRAWDLKEKGLIASCDIDADVVPTSLAVDVEGPGCDGLDIIVGFGNGSWRIWRLDIAAKAFSSRYRYRSLDSESIDAVAYAHPYILTITDSQVLSLYTLNGSSTPARPLSPTEAAPLDEAGKLEPTSSGSSAETIPSSTTPNPQLLASLKSHTSWPPLSLSIRKTPSTIIASIAYSLPTYASGYTVGLQELHLCPQTGTITFSRLASALPQGFSPLTSTLSRSTTPSPPRTRPPVSTPSMNHSPPRHSGLLQLPTSLSYSHPYILATHPDNTLTLYLCTSTASTLSITPGTKLWGHTSSVSSAEITARGKAVSVSQRGREVRIWELEGGRAAQTRSAAGESGVCSRSGKASGRVRRAKDIVLRVGAGEGSVEVRPAEEELDGEDDYESRKQWVGFDDEVVIVLKEEDGGPRALVVYDFT